MCCLSNKKPLPPLNIIYIPCATLFKKTVEFPMEEKLHLSRNVHISQNKKKKCFTKKMTLSPAEVVRGEQFLVSLFCSTNGSTG